MKANGSSWKFAIIFLSGIIIAAQLMFIIHWRWRFWQSQHWRTELPPHWEAIEPPASSTSSPNPQNKIKHVFIKEDTNLSKHGQIVQEMICPQRGGKGGGSGKVEEEEGCYAVVDGPSKYGSGFSRSLMIVLGGTMVPLSESDLNFPLHYKFTRETARQWPVLTNKVTVDYQKLLVAQPFITQTFAPSLAPWKIPEGKTRHILCLGLRASAINNFFANLNTKYDVTVVEPEPALAYIAKKWFGFEQTGHHRILVENPAFYVTARARLIQHPTFANGYKFNFIVVDLCAGIGARRPGKCPIDEFTEEKLVRELAANLAEDGTISINIFSLDSKGDIPTQHQLANAEHRMLYLYQRYFGHCYFVNIGANLILTCSRKGPMTRLRYHIGQRKLPRDLQMFKADEDPKFFLDIEAM